MTRKSDSSVFTSEKSFFSIYKGTLLLKPSTSNNIVFFLSVVFFGYYILNTSESEKILLNRARDWAMLGITFATTLLGFLIAGFTVFSSFTSREIFIKSAFVDDPNTKGLSYLKSFFFVFMKVFIYYVAFVFFSFVSYFLLGENSVLKEVCDINGFDSYRIVLNCSKICIFISAVWVIYLVLLLKSFIFNIYHVVMMTLRYEYEKSSNGK